MERTTGGSSVSRLINDPHADSDETLVAAVRDHDLVGVERALMLGANPNAMVDEFYSVLARAAQAGGPKSDIPIVRVLLRHGASSDGPFVIAGCRPELLDTLLAAGGHVDGPQRNGEPLFYALATRRKEDKALGLLEAGARFDVRDSEGQSPLITAARCARTKSLNRLLARGADTTCVDDSGRSALRHAIEGLASSIESQRSAYRSIIRTLAQYAPAQPEDLALVAIANNDVDALGRMFQAGMSADTRVAGTIGFIGITPETLIRQCGGLFEAMTGNLKQTTFDPIAGGSTLMMWAAALGKPDIVRILLVHGADANLRTGDGISACDISVLKGNAAVQKLLGTSGVSWHKYKPGRTFVPPPTSMVASIPRSRAQRLDVDLFLLDKRVRDRQKYTHEDGELAMEWGWDSLSVEHVRENVAGSRDAATRVVLAGIEHFAGDRGLPEICPHFWMRPYRCAFAAASLLRDDAALTHLAKWVNPGRPRGERSPMYNPHYFLWPMYQIWAAIKSNRPVQQAWRAMIGSETARVPKMLLAATDAWLAGDGNACLSNINRCVLHHKKATVCRGNVMAERVLSPEICWIASEAARTGVLPKLNENLGDRIVAEL